MKKALRVASLAAILALSSWLSTPHSARAASYPLCSRIHGTSCTTYDATRRCTESGGLPGACICEGSPLTWNC
jgi:hypothetical protein